MTINLLRITEKAVFFLVLLPNFGKSKIIPTNDEQKKENSTKDLKVASSYTYSKSGDGFDTFDYLPRFRSFHGLHSGSNFPLSSRDFNFPTRFKVGSYGGVGSKFGDIGSSPHGYEKKAYNLGVSNLDDSGIDIVKTSLDKNDYGPAVFELNPHDDSDDFLEKYDNHEHEEENHLKDEKERESAEKAEKSKAYKITEEFDKEEKNKKEQAEESGGFHENGGINKAHEDEEEEFKGEEESSDHARGEHLDHSEGHKKGHKTTGFHNVYHKDEFKKDTTFYDDEHEDGHQEVYNHEEEKHSKAEGEHKQAKKLDSAYEQSDKARQGFFTNGHQYGVAQGHDREEQSQEHHEKELESHKKDDQNHKTAQEQARSSSSHSILR